MGSYSEGDLPTFTVMTRAILLYGIAEGHVRDDASFDRYVGTVGAAMPLFCDNKASVEFGKLQDLGLIQGYPGPVSLTPQGSALVQRFGKAVAKRLGPVLAPKS